MTRTKSPFSAEGFKLVALGFTTLFLELVLIRYLGANIWNMGYFQTWCSWPCLLGWDWGLFFIKSFPTGAPQC